MANTEKFFSSKEDTHDTPSLQEFDSRKRLDILKEDISSGNISSDTLPPGLSFQRGARKDDTQDTGFFGSTDKDALKNGGISSISGVKQEKTFNEGKGYSSLDFKYSDQTGLLTEGVLGLLLGNNVAVVVDVEAGSEQARFLTTLGYKIDKDQKVKLTYEHFQKAMDYQFTSGKINETISQNSLGATYSLKLHDKRKFLDYIEANGYITKSQGKELADKNIVVDTPTLYELYRNKRNIAGGTKAGLAGSLGIIPWENGKIKFTLGGEKTAYDTINSSADLHNKTRVIGKVELEQKLSKDLLARISAATSTTEKCVLALELAYQMKPNLQLVLRGERIERFASTGLSDTSENIIGVGLRGTFATPGEQAKIDESARLWEAGKDKRQENKTRETIRKLPEAAKSDLLAWALSPAVKSTSVVATVDQRTDRLVILDKTLLPGAHIDLATGDISEALPNPDVIGIASVTLNGAPYTNNNNFGLSGGNIVIYTTTLREPAPGVTDTYRVTINETGGGTTIATINVQRGSVRVTSITFDRIPAPNQLPPTMGDVPNQAGVSGTAFNLAVAPYVTLTNGDAITTYTLTGALPTGVAFNTTTGILSGTPTQTGTFPLSVTATDNDGASNSDAFNLVIAAAPDTTPDAFALVDQNNVALSTVITSAPITVQGISAATAISVAGAGGEYSINGGAWTAAAGTVTNGQTVRVRHTSSGANSTAVNTTLTIGGVSDIFTSTTEAAAPANNPPTANNFTYGTDIDNAAKTFDWKVLSAAADVDGNTLTAAVQVQGTKGTFVIAGDNVTYTPNAGQTGSDTGTLRISDGQGGTKDIVVTVNNIDTLAPNTPTGGPTLAAVGGVYYSKLATSNITVNSATGGRLWINGVDSGVTIGAGGLYNYDANVAEGNNNFSYTIKDIFGNESAPLTFSVFRDTLVPVVSDLPNWGAGVASGSTTAKTVSMTDENAFAGSSIVSISPSAGSITGFDSATYGTNKPFNYVAPVNPAGSGPLTVTFTYTIRDAANNLTTQTQTLTVAEAPNANPVAADFSSADNLGNASQAIDFSSHVSDAESAVGLLQLIVVNNPTGFTVDSSAWPLVTVTAPGGWGGDTIITYKVRDPGGLDSTVKTLNLIGFSG